MRLKEKYSSSANLRGVSERNGDDDEGKINSE